jgi:WD40 repeat protein
MARDPSGRLLALFAGRGLHLRDLTTGASLLEIPAEVIAGEEGLELSDATMAHDGSFVALYAGEPHGPGGLFATRQQRLQVWDVATRTRRMQWSTEVSITDAVLTLTRRGRLRFAPDPRFVVTLLAQELRYWDVERGRAVRSAGLANGHLSGPIAFSADGRRLAVVHHLSSGDSSVGVMAFELGDSLRPLDSRTRSSRGGWDVVKHAVEVSALAFDPSGEVLASGDVGGEVRFTPLVAFPRPDEP